MKTSRLRWNIGLPGGPSGPFYSIVKSNGNVVAMQITDQSYAVAFQNLGSCYEADLVGMKKVEKKFREILKRDGVNNIEGAENYLLRAAAEAMFSE